MTSITCIGLKEWVHKSTNYSKHAKTVINTGDARISATYLVLMTHTYSMLEVTVEVGAHDDITCTSAGTEDTKDST